MSLIQASSFISKSLPLDLPETPSPARDSGAEIRATRRAAQWRGEMQRAWGYMRQRARTEAEAEAIDAELEQALEEGPDFTRYHGNASFDRGPKVSIDRNLAAKIMVVARAIERNSFAQRDKGKHGGALGRAAMRVLETLLFVVRPYHGRLCPSYDMLAELALMSRRTVGTAIETLERMGFITVHRRLKRITTALGFKTVQDTNAYDIHPPKGFFGRIAYRLFFEGSECKNFPANKIRVFNSDTSHPSWAIPDGIYPLSG